VAKGPDHAIFGRGSGINRQRRTGVVIVLVCESILYGAVAVPERLIAETTMDVQIDAQSTAYRWFCRLRLDGKGLSIALSSSSSDRGEIPSRPNPGRPSEAVVSICISST